MLSTTIPVNLLTINWEITARCNNKCPYCKGVRSSRETPIERIKHMIPLINDIINCDPNKVRRLDIIGGEPTIHKNFFDILTIINNEISLDSMLVCSNGTRSIDFYKKFINHVKNIPTLACSITYHKVSGSLEELFKKYRMLVDNGITCQPLKLIITPDDYDDVLYYHNLIKKYPDVSFTLKLLYGTTYNDFIEPFLDAPNYKDFTSIKRDDLGIIHYNVPRSTDILNNSNFYYGMCCYPWYNLNINTYGVVSPICKADRLSCSVKYGMFIDNNTSIIKEKINTPIICQNNYRCDTIMTPKFKVGYEDDILSHRKHNIQLRHYPYIEGSEL